MNLAKFPRRGYVKSPTPIEYLPNFSKALDNKVNVYIKRDDLPAVRASTKPANLTSPLPTPSLRAQIRSSPAAPYSQTTAA